MREVYERPSNIFGMTYARVCTTRRRVQLHEESAALEEFKLEGHEKDIMEGHPACLYFATIENILH